jgi:hypothetical protein
LPAREWDAANGLEKINPLADWSEREVWAFIRHQVPYNPLHDQGYPSIGCAPCTRAITVGEDVRAGRWWWENAETKECGLAPAPKEQFRKGQSARHPPYFSSLCDRTRQEHRRMTMTTLDHPHPQPSRLARSRRHPHPARGGRPVRQPGAAVLRRQGFDLPAAAGRKGVSPRRFPFPLLHIDTGHNYPEVIAFRDRRAAELASA